MNICIYACMSLQINEYVWICMNECMCKYVFMYAYIYVCIYIMYVCMCVCMHACMYEWVCVYNLCMYIHK